MDPCGQRCLGPYQKGHSQSASQFREGLLLEPALHGRSSKGAAADSEAMSFEKMSVKFSVAPRTPIRRKASWLWGGGGVGKMSVLFPPSNFVQYQRRSQRSSESIPTFRSLGNGRQDLLQVTELGGGKNGDQNPVVPSMTGYLKSLTKSSSVSHGCLLFQIINKQ